MPAWKGKSSQHPAPELHVLLLAIENRGLVMIKLDYLDLKKESLVKQLLVNAYQLFHDLEGMYVFNKFALYTFMSTPYSTEQVQ